MEKNNKTTFTMRMPTDIHECLEEYAKKNYTSMSKVIVQLIIKLIKEEIKNDEK